ncbi:MAG: SDH family Clp fold serine proteinase [Acidilobaceae archaeon]
MLVNGVVDVVHAFKVFAGEGSRVLGGLEGVSGLLIVPLLFSPSRYIDEGSVDSIYSVLRGLRPSDGLGVVLLSDGDVDEAYLLARYLQRIARGRLVVYVPRYAKSAGTLLALAGDELVMLPVAELGPIDPLLYDAKTGRYVPLQSILEMLDLLSGKTKDLALAVLDRIPVIELGYYKRAVEHNIELCTRVLASRMMKGDWEKSSRVAERLASYKQHGAAVTIDDLEEIGLNVREARGEEEEMLWRPYELWVDNIVEVEKLTPPKAREPVEFKLGRGVVLTTAPLDLVEKAKST